MNDSLKEIKSIAFFHGNQILYDLIAFYIKEELKLAELKIYHSYNVDGFIKAISQSAIDVAIINYASLFDGAVKEHEVRRFLTALSGNQKTITVLFYHSVSPLLLKKLISTGINILISAQDEPKDLSDALLYRVKNQEPVQFISRRTRENLLKKEIRLTPKEWEVINLIGHGYSLSEIALKKCRAMSTVSTQKRSAMNKLQLKNHGELLQFLQQNKYF